MSDKNVLMLDVILKNMQKMEDHISATKKKLHEVQEATLQDKREYTSLQDKNKELEKSIARARHSLAGANTRLSSSLLLMHHLEEELAREEEKRQQQLRELEAESSREMEAAGAWSRALLQDHYNKLRLDNPAIPARREAMAQELAQLRLEETRQSCEIKVLEDIDKERERLEKRIQEEEKEEEELRGQVTELKEKTTAAEGMTRQLEKRRDELQRCPSEQQEEVVGLREKLSELQQERDYLKAALEAMRKEWRQLQAQYGFEESHEGITDSQQSTTSTKGARGREEDSGGTGTELSTKKQRTTIPTTTCSSSSSLPSISTSTVFDMPSPTQEHSHSYPDMDTDEFIAEMLRDINWTTDIDLLDTHTQNEQEEERNGVSGGNKRISISNGPTPSTPRTFTRNPAPPTPNSEDETRPLLQHILANPPQAPPSQPRSAARVGPIHTPRQQDIHVRPTPTTASTTMSSFSPSSLPSSSFSVSSFSYSSSSLVSSFSSSSGLLRTPRPLLPCPAPPSRPVRPAIPLPALCPPHPPHSSSHPPQPLLPSSSRPSLLNHPSCPGPPPPIRPFPPHPQRGQRMTVTSTFKPVHPCLSSSTSNLLSTQPLPKTPASTATSLRQPWNASNSRGTTTFTLRSGIPQGTYIGGMVRLGSQGTFTTSQGERSVRFSNLASAVTPRLCQPTSASNTHPARLPRLCSPMGIGQQRSQQQLQRPQQQQQKPHQQQKPQQQQQKPQQQQKRPQHQQQKPWQQQKSQQQQKPQHPLQQGHGFEPWQAQKGLTSPSKRRIRFSELTEVLGTPESDSGQ